MNFTYQMLIFEPCTAFEYAAHQTFGDMPRGIEKIVNNMSQQKKSPVKMCAFSRVSSSVFLFFMT